jgi:flavin-dependent thymidylate synthase
MDSTDTDAQNAAEFTLKNICKKYFVGVTNKNVSQYAHCLYWYLLHIEKGGKAEDARDLLPNATKTNIVLTCNLRELMHICNERLCTRAQKEIRELVHQMRNGVVGVCPELGKYLQPKCEILGYCREHKSCGRKETL